MADTIEIIFLICVDPIDLVAHQSTASEHMIGGLMMPTPTSRLLVDHSLHAGNAWPISRSSD